MLVSDFVQSVKSLKKSSPALQAILEEAGLSQVDSFLLAAVIDSIEWEGLSGDDVAGALLRWRNQSSRGAYLDGYEEASVVLAGIPQKPLVNPWGRE